MHSIPTRRSNLVTRVIQGETVILDQASGQVHQLNETASYIWERCDGIKSAADIAADVAAHFGAQLDMVTKDVANALVEFEKLGLLISGSGPDK